MMVESKLKYKTLAVNGDTFLLYRKGTVYAGYQNCNHIVRVARLPVSKKKIALSQARLFERLLRLEPRCACALGNDRFLLSYSGAMYSIDLKEKKGEHEFTFRPNMNNPLSITSVYGLAGFEDGEYFGEYFSNNDNEEVCVYKRSNGLYEKVYAFLPNTVYHIHGIVADKKRNCIYILTGDKDCESAIWEARDNFKTVKPILIGAQKFRACVAFSYQDGILYATDTSREQNYLYYAKEQSGFWHTEAVCKLPGPCIYGTSVGQNYYFATSVEPDDTLSERRFRYTYKLGKGVNDRYTRIIKFNKEGTKEIYKAKKDIFPMLLFQFGNCLFPSTRNCNKLIFCPISVKGDDGKTIIMDID